MPSSESSNFNINDQVFLYKAHQLADEFDSTCIPLLDKANVSYVIRSHMMSKTEHTIYTYYFRCYSSEGYVVTCEYFDQELTDAGPLLRCEGKEELVYS